MSVQTNRNAGLKANVTSGRNEIEKDLNAQTLNALYTGQKSQQIQKFKRLRSNAIKETRKKTTKKRADWLANQLTNLDKAFWRGYYFSQNRRTEDIKANDQTLDFDEWEGRDEDNLQEVRYPLTMVDDVINAGFTVDVSLARTVFTRQKESKWEVEGEVSMDGRAESRRDEAVLSIFGTPIPICHVDYEIPQREQQQSQNFGEDLDTRKARQAGRILRETEEDLFISGWGPTVTDSEGNTLTMYGYTDSTVAITGNAAGDWGTPSNIHQTIRDMLNDLESQTTNNNRGPQPAEMGAWLYYHPNQRSDLRAPDPEGDGNMSVMQRIEQDFPYLDLRTAGGLSDGEVVMVVQDPRWIEALTAQSPTNISEEIDMGFATKYKALSSRIPFVKKTYDGVKGVNYYTGA